jgi:uncharacterized protein GlcG (DUF336 family)
MKRSTRLGYMLAGAVLAGAIGLTLTVLPAATAQEEAAHEASHHAPGAQPPTPAPLTASDISDHQAHAILAAAVNKATEIDTKMDITIVDAGGNLKAFLRMDGAWLGSIDIAIKKAKTARYFDMNTGDIGALSQPGGPLYNIEHSNGGLITFPGGIPLKDGEGNVIGAIGVSGSLVENDHAVAQAGADAAN